MRRSVVFGVMWAVLLTGLVAPTAQPVPIDAQQWQDSSALSGRSQGKKGRLKVSVAGTGSYAIRGNGTCAVNGQSKSFRLAPGRYTVLAAGAKVHPSKVRVRLGKRQSVRVAFQKQLPPGAVQRVSANARGIPANDDSDGFAVWSPDGSRIAFMSLSNNLLRGSGRGGLFVKTLATGRVDRVVSFTPGFGSINLAGNLAWSPDGTRIAFDTGASNVVPGDTNGAEDVFVVSLTTGEVVRASVDSQGRQAGNNADSYSPDWSPDGTRLAFVSDQLAPEDDRILQSIYIKDLASGAVQYISTDRYHASDPAWSPDGSRIAWSEVGIQVRDVVTGYEKTVVADRAAGLPAWSPDGTRIAYSIDLRHVYVINSATGQRDRVSMDSKPGYTSFGASWSPCRASDFVAGRLWQS